MFFDMARRMANPTAKDAPALPPSTCFDPQGLTKANEAFAKHVGGGERIVADFHAQYATGRKTRSRVAMKMLGKVFDPRAWFAGTGGMDETLQKMAEGPRLADFWDTERKVLKLFNAWTALRKRASSTTRLCWKHGSRRPASSPKTSTRRKTERRRSARGATCWRCGSRPLIPLLLETQRSDSYLKSQREILKASTDLRLAQQEMAAFYSEMFGYPTREELDDVHRTVTELRRELRALQRASRGAAENEGAATESARASISRTGARHHDEQRSAHGDQTRAGDFRGSCSRREDRARRDAYFRSCATMT